MSCGTSQTASTRALSTHTAQSTLPAFLVCFALILASPVSDANTFKSVTLPELIAQTNMDQQSVNRLREELVKFTNWFSRHVTAYFVSEYETPGADYTEKARGA